MTVEQLKKALTVNQANPDLWKDLLDVDGDGNVVLRVTTSAAADSTTSPIEPYEVARQDAASATIKYYGFLKSDSKWYILKHDGTTTSDQEYTYFNGASDFATGWTNRATHTYVEFDALTGL